MTLETGKNMHDETTEPSAGGAPEGNRNAVAHGFYSTKRQLNLRSFDELDKRKRTVRQLLAVRDDLINELGGAEHVTMQERIIIDNVARDVALRDTIDAYVFGLDSILKGYGKSKVGVPILKERDAIVKRLLAGLTALGLERRARPITSATDLVHAKTDDGAAGGGAVIEV